jgi:protoheme IX farnesyltransferase
MLESLLDLGSPMPWFMFLLIFLWTPPHFWALALYRSEEYERVGVPMMPNAKGPERTLMEMKVYVIILLLLSMNVPSYHELAESGAFYFVLGGNVVLLTIWYANSVWKIDLEEERDPTGRIPTAARSFFASMLYLALMFIVLVAASFGLLGAGIGAVISATAMVRSEIRTKS